MALKIIIKGDVQGVLFRDFIKETADNLNIKGTVKNLSDGTVEVIAEGDDESLRTLAKACSKGPHRARVDDISTSVIKDQKYKTFDIEY